MPLPYWLKSGLDTTRSQIGWNPASGNSTLLTLVPAGHTPGVYLVSSAVIVRTVAGAGTCVPNCAHAAPTIGAQTVTVNAGQSAISLTALGLTTATSWTIVSDGTAAITFRYVPTGATGSPVVDVYASAQLIATLT
jgi:hypothetical protein